MRRPRRSDPSSGSEIAMMAVITKAMGAFLVLVVLLMPYYVVNTNIEALTQNVQEKMDRVKSQSSTTLENVKQALQKAGKGRLTDQEIDALEAQIKQLETDLAAAEAEVDRLNSRVKQQASQIARLQKEAEELKKEIERLKRNQGDPPLVISQLTWSGCTGTRFAPLIRVTDKDASTSQPVSRRADAAFDTAQIPWKLDDDGGVNRASLPIGDTQKAIDVFFLRLNGVMADHTSCQVRAEVLVKNRAYPLGTFEIQDETVGFLGRVKISRNSIEPVQVGRDDLTATLNALLASDCEDLTCVSKDKPGTENEIAGAFANYLVKAKVPEDMAKELAAAVATNRMAPAAAFRWGQLVIDLQNAPTGQPAFDIPGEFLDLLERKGAPPLVRASARDHAIADEATLNSTIKKLKGWPDALDPTLFPVAESLRKSGMPSELANASAAAIANKRLTEDDAKAWADLLKKANIGGPIKYSSPKIDILQSSKVQSVKGGLALPLAETLAGAVNEGQATRDEVLTLLDSPVRPTPDKCQCKTFQPSQAPASGNARIDPALQPLVTSGALSERAAVGWTQAFVSGMQNKEVKLMAAQSDLQASLKLPSALVDLLARRYAEGTMTMEQIKKLNDELSN